MRDAAQTLGSLIDTHHPPLTTHHPPRTTHHAPLTTHHSPLTTRHSLPTAHRFLPTIRFATLLVPPHKLGGDGRLQTLWEALQAPTVS